MDIYCISTTLLQPVLPRILALLPPERRAKAEACRKPDDRLRCAAAGLLLLQILHVGADRPLAYSACGKPFLPGGPQFSLSHSGSYAVLAVDSMPLGIDIEAPRTVSPLLRQRCFTPEEQHWAGDDDSRYLQLWTRKESVMKASGRGFSLAAREIGVLGDTVCADGRVWHPQSCVLDGCPLSAAACGPFAMAVHRVGADILPAAAE